MKILKIRFENIHSLQGLHEVDFAEGPLDDAGLFAITGPTGSGKSTLLDVITLALYNRIARVEKAVSNSILEDDGGIMTRNMQSCFAEVEYQVKGKSYRSHWSIERNRNNNLKQRKQEIVELPSGEILEEGTKAPDKNTEIIGLSYDQFVKAMVLSQGEFSKLLQAPRNERNRLLEDITGARSYREIGKAVYFRFKGIGKNIELKEANLEGIELLSAEAIKEKKSELKALEDSRPQIEKDYQNASDKIKTRQDLLAKENEWKELEKEKSFLNKDLEIFNEWKAKLELHDRLSKYGENIREFETVTKELDNLNEESKQLQSNKASKEQQQKSYLEVISELLKETVHIGNANKKLEEFRNKINLLQTEEDKKRQEATLYQNQVNKEVRNINQLDYKLSKAENPTQFKAEFDSFKNNIQKSIEASGIKSMQDLNSELDLYRNKFETAGKLLIKKEASINFEIKLKTKKEKLESAEKTLTTDLEKKKFLEREIPILKKEVGDLEKILEHQRKHQSLEIHRQQLKTDEPCPLCGSLDHPYASEEPHFDVHEELLKEKKKSLTTKTEHIVTLSANHKFQSKEIIELQTEIKSINEDKAENNGVLIELSKQLDWNPREDLQTLQRNRNGLSKTIQEMEKSKQEFQAQSIIRDLSESLTLWTTTLDSYISLKKERKALYNGEDFNEIANDFTSKITESITNISLLEKQLRSNKEKVETTASVKIQKEDALKTIVLKEQIESIMALKNAILPEEKANRIRKQGNKLNEQKTRISEKQNSLEKFLKELRAKDNSETSFETLKELFEEAKKQWDTLSVQRGKISQSLDDDQKAKKRQKKVLDEISLLKKDLALWKSMNDLIGDATGNKFSNFVQDLTLEQLILFANQRLAEFSDRYILDIPTADEVDKSDTLKIFDKYMGNARRSVRTLSGGETFLVSLAMAFALSDIAAKNVKIESLFIDEGFGTLDPETLDQAITILEKMQNEGDKSVGIISHVSSLKERITTQIKLDKGSLGYSTLEVVQ